MLREVLQNAYPSLFTEDFSLKRVTTGQLVERFEKLGVRGDTQRHCISFFLHMAAEAEKELSPHLAGRSKLGIGRKSVVLKSRERMRRVARESSLEINKGPKIGQLNLSNLHPAMAGLLAELPPPSTPWNMEEKAKFKKAFEAILDVVYPSND